VRPLAPLAAAILLLAAAACGEEGPPVAPRPTLTPTVAAPTATATPARTVRDMLGREVGLPSEVRRVVALSPTAYDLLTALGLEPVAATSDAPPAGGGTAIGRTLSPDFQAIAALAPDLVIADARFHSGLVRDLDAFPYPTFFVDVNGYGDVLEALEALGDALGRKERAAQVADTIRRQAEAIRTRVADQRAPRVLVLTGAERDLYAASRQTYIGNLLDYLGAVNVMADAPPGAPLPGFAATSPGDAAALGPEVILVIPAGENSLADWVLRDPALAGVPAVAAGRVYALDVRRFLRAPGPSVVDALAELARLLFPSVP
jgi:ABC-type Fe3+-hydroxamate transport system substrate-binding protein